MENTNARFVALGNQYEADRDQSHLEEMFHIVDTDRDGYISKGELVRIFQETMGEEADTFASLILETADHNCDDQLSLHEFIEFITKACENDLAKRKERIDELERLYREDFDRAHLVEIFHIIDTDHDGVLKKSELLATTRSHMTAETAERISKAIIQKADKDGDQLLTVNEFVEFAARSLPQL